MYSIVWHNTVPEAIVGVCDRLSESHSDTGDKQTCAGGGVVRRARGGASGPQWGPVGGGGEGHSRRVQAAARGPRGICFFPKQN